MSLAAITSAVSQNQSLSSLFSVNRINPISGKDADGDDGARVSGIQTPGKPQKVSPGKLTQAVLQTVSQMLGNSQQTSHAPSLTQSNESLGKGDPLKRSANEFVQTLLDALQTKEGLDTKSAAGNMATNKYQANSKMFDIGIEDLAQQVLTSAQTNNPDQSQKVIALQSSANQLLEANSIPVNSRSAGDLLQGIAKLLDAGISDAGSVVNVKA